MPRFHPQVRRDATQAIRHYDSISDSLGDDFWTKFEDACHRVESHPERFHSIRVVGDARILNDFPITCSFTKNPME